MGPKPTAVVLVAQSDAGGTLIFTEFFIACQREFLFTQTLVKCTQNYCLLLFYSMYQKYIHTISIIATNHYISLQWRLETQRISCSVQKWPHIFWDTLYVRNPSLLPVTSGHCLHLLISYRLTIRLELCSVFPHLCLEPRIFSVIVHTPCNNVSPSTLKNFLHEL